MAKRGKKGKLQTLPLDISAMAGEPLERVAAVAGAAYQEAVHAYDAGTSQAFVASGKSVAPMGHRVKVSTSGVTLTLAVGTTPLSISSLDVRPGLGVATTGNNRQPVRVTGKKSLTVDVPRGFIWNGGVFMRRENLRKIDNAKPFLIKAGADPSPARMLWESQREVVEAATSIFLGAIDAGKNRK
jgi:hypothetical protein